MGRSSLTKLLVVLLLVSSGQTYGRAESITAKESQTATGYVFYDANNNRQRDAGEQGLACVRVSNGREVVCTDENGLYQLPVTGDTILFVIKPQGWRTPLSKNLTPEFYYIHKPNGSP